ncbi:MAG: dihydroorotase family protein [Candidatus Bipolaricaulia bacterium]
MIVLAHGKAFIDGALRQVDIGFDRTIRAIGARLDLEGERIDCTGKLILPGVIDVHVHFRDFNERHKETWATGVRAALRGGVTTVFDMPNNDPPTTTLEQIQAKRRLAERTGINYGLYLGVTRDNLDQIPKWADEVDAFKLYMGHSTGNLGMTERWAQRLAFQAVAETGKVLTVHAEDQGLIDAFTQKCRGRNDPKVHGDCRPKLVESVAVSDALGYAFRYRTKLHLAHVTTELAVHLIESVDDVDVTAETCPHYLIYTEEALAEQGPRLKINPPLRSERDREVLWEAIRSGTIDLIASDHAPHTLEEKSRDIWEAPSGMPGVETTLPLILDAVNRGKLSLGQAVELLSINPAKRFGLTRKGKIEIGLDADLTVVDMELERPVRREHLATRCGWSPYEGMSLRGWPVMTFVGGRLRGSGQRSAKD